MKLRYKHQRFQTEAVRYLSADNVYNTLAFKSFPAMLCHLPISLFDVVFHTFFTPELHF